MTELSDEDERPLLAVLLDLGSGRGAGHVLLTVAHRFFPFLGCLLHAIEMAFERIDVGRPEAPERREPGVDLHERLGPDPIDAPLGFDARLHEAGLAQHAQVLGHRGLRHPQPALDFADGSLRRRQQAEDGPAVRLRDDRER